MVSATAFLLHSTCGDTWRECLHTGEEILTLTQNQLSEATEELVDMAQRAEDKVFREGPLQ